MIINKKTSLGKKQLAIIITSSVLALLVIAYVIIAALIGAASGGGDGTAPPEILEGEAVYGTSAVAYPTFYESDIQEIVVQSHNGTFSMKRPDEKSSFIFYYVDDDGQTRPYYPDIASSEGSFDYTDLYAKDQTENLGMYKISYLANALGYMYFGQRIYLSSDSAVRAAELDRYGLSVEEREGIEVTYLDAEGKEQTHVIFIGDKLVSGVGYYFMVNGRDYVYTGVNNRFDYALGGFESFLHTRLVAEGLAEDGLYEPYLTSDYRQWKNKVFSNSRDDEDGIFDSVAAGSEAVGVGALYTSVYDGEEREDGYTVTSKRAMSVDLSEIAAYPEYERLVATLTGKALGSYSDKIVATVITDTLEIDFGEAETVTYSYKVTAVESVLTANGEYITAEALSASGESARLVRVTYDLYLGGEKQNPYPYHGVIDLGDTTVPEQARIALMGCGIGAADVSFDVNYDKQTASTREYAYVISEIALSVKLDDKGNVSYGSSVKEDSIVTYRYYYMADVLKVGEEQSRTVDLSSITSGDELSIKNKLVGKKVGKTGGLTVLSDVIYCQAMMNFSTYVFESVDYYVTRELVTSFEFVNASNRDPFYGESLYINTLPSGHDNYGYALNSTACETVVKLLGGIGADTSQYSEGLLGAQTVAVGITPEKMEKYGLYAYTVYFELPRSIQTVEKLDEEVDLDEIDDYTSLSTLGFTLYISEPDENGVRYIGSDMYDIIVKIEEDGFDYLDESFVDYWARRGLVMIGYEDIDSMSVELFMKDVFGRYELDMDHKTVWISGNQHLEQKPESGGQAYDFLTVNISTSGDCFDTALSRYFKNEGISAMSLAALYNRVGGAPAGYDLTLGHDTLGTANFKDFLLIMFSTYFGDSLTAEEKLLANEDNLLMRMSFSVGKSSAYPYVYEFYRIDDRRVMVSITQTGGSGHTVMRADDFYISTFAFKKIVRNFTDLLNGASLNGDVGYVDGN